MPNTPTAYPNLTQTNPALPAMTPTPCADCGKLITDICDSYRHEDKMYCDTCFHEKYFICQDCDNVYILDEARGYDDDYYCSDCFYESHNYCEHCNESIYTGDGADSRYCEDSDVHYCACCFPGHADGCDSCGGHDPQDAPARPRYADVKTDKIINGKHSRSIFTTRAAGIELEVERGNASKLKPFSAGIGVSEDGSLDSTGIEIQTPPATNSKLHALIKEVTDNLAGAGYKATRSCGFHLHLDAADLRTNQARLSRLLKLYYATEDILYGMLPPSRWHNKYCLQLRSQYTWKDFRAGKLDLLQQHWYKTKSKREISRRSGGKYDNTRYAGVNIHSVFYRGTLELRQHSGTLSPEKILHWVNLNMLYCDVSANTQSGKLARRLLIMPISRKKIKLFCRTILAGHPKLQNYLKNRLKVFAGKNYRNIKEHTLNPEISKLTLKAERIMACAE